MTGQTRPGHICLWSVWLGSLRRAEDGSWAIKLSPDFHIVQWLILLVAHDWLRWMSPNIYLLSSRGMPRILHNIIFIALSVSREEEVDLGGSHRHVESINKFLFLRGAWRNASFYPWTIAATNTSKHGHCQTLVLVPCIIILYKINRVRR